VLGPDGYKMSKSRGNVIPPDEVVGRYGADAVRAYLMFMGPFDQGGPWNNQGIEGVWRYLNRVWTLVTDYTEQRGDGAYEGGEVAAGAGVERLRHKTIARISGDYGELRFNTALAGLMEYVNGLNKARDEQPAVVRDPRFAAAIDTLLVLVAPMTPFITEELWHSVGHEDSVHAQPWPAYDSELIVDEVVTVVVQVNGKVRDRLEVSPDTAEPLVRELALASAKVQAATGGREPKKFVYVPGRLANIVV
jgi:leucyl-tRNA synthetase